MRPFTLKIQAGEEKAFFFGAQRNYIRLEANSTVNVTVKSPDNSQEYTLTPGDDVLLMPFDDLRISHDGAADTSFILYVGKDTKAGSASVSGNIQPVGGSANTANPPLVNVNNAPEITPKTMNASWFNTAASTALQTIVTPAANTAGVIVHGIGIPYAPAFSRFMTKASAPAAWSDAAAKTLQMCGGAGSNSTHEMAMPIIIPAGEGLYFQCSSSSNTWAAWADYEVL